MNLSRADLAANPQLIKLISQEQLALLGLMTPAQAKNSGIVLSSKPPTNPTSNATGKPELQAHAEFLAWIKKLNRSLPPKTPLLTIHCDPTKAATILPGWPDFSLIYLADFRPLFLEFKRNHKAKLSAAQTLIHSYLHALGHSVLIVTSSSQAITHTSSFFHLNAP